MSPIVEIGKKLRAATSCFRLRCGGNQHLMEVRGFVATAPPASAPEPVVEGLIGSGLAALSWFARRRRIAR